MNYIFKYRKRFLWKTIKNVKGHRHQPDIDRMDIFLNDGILSLSNWSNYDMKLGNDFILSQKAQMEKETGQNIPLDTGA